MSASRSLQTRLYLALRDGVRRAGVSPALYRRAGMAVRRVAGMSETLVEDVERDARRDFARTLMAGEDLLDAAVAARGAPAVARDVFRALRNVDSRDELRLAQRLHDRPEPALRQVGRLLLSERAAFWRDFLRVETLTEAYLDEAEGQTDQGLDVALRLCGQAKRRLGRRDAALEINLRRQARAPLDIDLLTQRARILQGADTDEMLRLLRIAGAESGMAGPQGNTLYLTHLCETGAHDEVERIARLMETHIPENRVARAFLNNAIILREGDPRALGAVFETMNLDCAIARPDFDGLRFRPVHPAPAGGPLVSVVMTAFDAEDHVATAIASILGQTHDRIELLVVDDCSTDGTAAAVEAIAARDDRVRLLRTPQNSGTYVAKNQGLRAAAGAFVTLCDSDDIWTPDHLALHLAAMDEDPARMVSTSNWLRVFDDLRIDVAGDGSIVEVCPHSTFFRRAVFDRLGYFDGVRFGADREFIARITLEYGHRAVHHIYEVLTIGRRHNASLTTSGAGKLGPDNRSDLRLRYWQRWNAWHHAQVAAGAPIYNSGVPSERPYAVPDGME